MNKKKFKVRDTYSGHKVKPGTVIYLEGRCIDGKGGYYTTDGFNLQILMDSEVEEAVERALEKNDADYSYDVFDAVLAVEFLIDCTWYKLDDTKETKDRIIYMIETLHEDTSPYNNQVKLWKYKGSDCWTLEVCAGQYGEQQDKDKFAAKGFKEAQEQATKKLVYWIKKGLELNV